MNEYNVSEYLLECDWYIYDKLVVELDCCFME